MKDFKISIPTPCHEDWKKMSPNSNGRFCSSCEKTVVDFTNKKSVEIKSFLDNSTGEVCGRFNANDIYKPTVEIAPEWQIKNSWFRSKWLAMTAIISMIGIGKKANAQMVGQVVALDPPPPQKTVAPKKTSTVIHGWVKSIDEKKGISQIEIRVYSGGKEIAYKQNFANGSYFITVPENTIWDFKVDIEYSSVNYTTQILHDLPIERDRIKCDVNLSQIKPELNYTVMGGVGAYYDRGTIIEPPIENVVGQIDRYYENPSLEQENMYTFNRDTNAVNETTDVHENSVLEKTFDVIAYPNPGIGLFNFKIENSERSEIFIFDIEGKLVDSRKTTSTSEMIDLTNQPNGTYVVRVVSISLNKVKQLKVIKIK
jgi:Secretion system C-terminal sorting domain